MELVILTHQGDLHLCRWQLKSIGKYLEPCTVHIIVNEQDTIYAEEFLKKEVETLRHTVLFWSRTKIIGNYTNDRGGWVTQQVLKLLIPTNGDYIVLDCKDIFLRKTSMNDLAKEQRKRQPDALVSKTWKVFAERLTARLLSTYPGVQIDFNKVRGIQTPRFITKEMQNKIIEIWGDKKNFVEWFFHIDMPSEFILYDSLRLYNNCMPEIYFDQSEIIGIWNENDFKVYNFDKIPKKTRIIKLHRRLLKNKKTYRREN